MDGRGGIGFERGMRTGGRQRKRKESLKPESAAFPLPDINLPGRQSGCNYSGKVPIK